MKQPKDRIKRDNRGDDHAPGAAGEGVPRGKEGC